MHEVTTDDIARLLQKQPPWLKRTVANVLGRHNCSYVVEEIIQDAIKAVILNGEKQRCRTAPEVHGYLKRIAINKAIDYLKQDYVKLREWLPSAQDEEDKCSIGEGEDTYGPRVHRKFDDLSHPWELSDLIVDVRRALAKLNSLDRRIAELYAEGFRVREIADLLHLKRSTVDRWWRLGIAPYLRRHLAAYADNLPYLLRREREWTLKWGI